jgi:hypothetical protein
LKSSSMLSTRQLYRSNNQPANYAALTQFAPEPSRLTSVSLQCRLQTRRLLATYRRLNISPLK